MKRTPSESTVTQHQPWLTGTRLTAGNLVTTVVRVVELAESLMVLWQSTDNVV